MTRSEDDDDSKVIDISAGDGRKLVTPAKEEQLRAARVKALESRKRSQAVSLEQRLMEVRQWLSQHADSGAIEKVQHTLLDQARDMHRRQKQTLSSFTELLNEESTKRAQDSASIKKTIDKMRGDIEQLKSTTYRASLSTIHEPVERKTTAPSTVVTTTTTSKASASAKPSVPLSQVKERQLL